MSTNPMPLDYAPPHSRFRMPGYISGIIMVPCVFVSSYFYAMFRTMSWGFEFLPFVMLSMFLGAFFAPWVLLGCWGQRWRSVLLCVLLVVFLPAVAGELWAGAQEFLFARKRRLAPAISASEARWQPFRTSHIGYVAASKSFYGGD